MKNINKINWTDGMLITQAHLDLLYEYIDYHDGISQYMIYGGEFNFGLINTDFNQNALELQIINDELILIRLNALFKNGTLINYNNNQYKVNLKFSSDSIRNAGEKNVISVYLDDTLALFGDADPQEFPPRIPYIERKLKLICIPEKEYIASKYEATYLPIGILKNDNGLLTLSDQYIPPVLNVMAHPILLKKFKEYHTTLLNIYQNSLYASQIALDSLKNGRINYLAESIQFISERLSDFIANNIDSYKLNGALLPTWEWYLIFKKLGRNLLNSFTTLKGMDAQDVKNYIDQWTRIKPNELNQCIEDIINDDFNPKLINQSIQRIDYLMEKINLVFEGFKGLREFQKTNNMPWKEEENVKVTPTPEKESYKLPFNL